jgi:CheY-like chemotaxis protein
VTPQNRQSLRDVKVLVVDDHPTNRRVMSEMLTWGGCLVEEAASAEEGLRVLREAANAGVPHGLLVTDVHMPAQDGFEFAAAVRADSLVGGIPIMMLTSGGRKGDGQRCRELGIGAYLLKPVSRTELVEAAVGSVSGPVARSSQMHLITRHSFNENRRNLRILLAEDNPVNQEVAAAMLRKRGHTVDISSNGREAVEAAARTSYDVILMDLQMPEMDGLKATAEIRKLPAERPVPIIAVTANAMSGERERCLAAGMDEYLAKPFRPHDLFAIVEGWGTAEASMAAPPQKNSAAPVDIEALRAELRLAGVEEIATDLLNTFIMDAPDRIAALQEAANGTDAGAIERAAHAYKSAAGTVKAQQLAALLKEAELAARAGDAEKASALVSRIAVAHDAAINYLRSTLGAG